MEDSYNILFKKTWRPVNPSKGGGKAFWFMENLKRLKKETFEWAKEKKVKEEEDLMQIGLELDQLECPKEDGYGTEGKRERIKMLESKHRNILATREE